MGISACRQGGTVPAYLAGHTLMPWLVDEHKAVSMYRCYPFDTVDLTMQLSWPQRPCF